MNSTIKRKGPSSTEHNALQRHCFTWVWNELPEIRGRIYAIVNNAPNQVQASLMKGIGFNKGIWDMVIAGKNGMVFIEFKTGEAVLSKEQLEFKKNFGYNNVYFYVVKSFEDFVEIITIHL